MRRRGDAPRRMELTDRSANVQPVTSLPLVHVTAAAVARDVLRSDQLTAYPCEHLGEPGRGSFVYFFVGRPARRLHDHSVPSEDVSNFPFVFLSDPDAITPHAVHPFDTGAALTDRLAGASRYLSLADYELPTSHEAIRRHIRWAFGDVNEYLRGRLRPDLLEGVPAFEAATRSFVDIARSADRSANTAGRPDDRAATVEVATRFNVPLGNGTLKAVIAPDCFLEDGGVRNVEVMSKIDEAGARIETYKWRANTTAEDFREQINQRASALITEWGGA